MDINASIGGWKKRIHRCSFPRLAYPLIAATGLMGATLDANALTFQLPEQGKIVGHVSTATVLAGESFTDVARKNDIGYYELLEANPSINPMHPKAGQVVTIPTRYILPSGPREGIVINTAELRLYYYPPGQNTVVTEPIGIGRQGWETPTGDLSIIQKQKDPTWHAPPAVIADLARKGIYYPKEVPPGPDNPLGRYMMRLSNHTYLIHGTNAPQGVGRRVSAGCIRMYPEDVERLFYTVGIGTKVRIVNEPYKVAWVGNNLYMESHQPLKETRRGGQLSTMWTTAVKQVAGLRNSVSVDWARVNQVGHAQSGIPAVVGTSS
jgi:L,D-transpeptidase ErfK/SrfK